MIVEEGEELAYLVRKNKASKKAIKNIYAIKKKKRGGGERGGGILF